MGTSIIHGINLGVMVEKSNGVLSDLYRYLSEASRISNRFVAYT
jgi:hypothetical protein